MSPRLPRVAAADVVRALHRDKWFDDEQEGSHLHLRHPTKPGKVTVPTHRGKIIKPGLLSGILKDASLTPDKFRRLL